MYETKCQLLVDGHIVITLDEDKLLLVRELLRHYQPRMNAKAHEELAAGKTPDIKEYICGALKPLGLDYEMSCISETVTIVTDEGNTANQPVKVEPTASRKAGTTATNPMLGG